MAKKGEILRGELAQQSAILKVHEVARILEQDWLFRILILMDENQLITYVEIAQTLSAENSAFEGCYDHYPRVFINAIGMVVRRYKPASPENDSITHQKNVQAGKESMRRKKTKGIFEEHQKRAGEIASQALKDNGGWAARQRAMLEGQGAVGWHPEEERLLETLKSQKQYRNQNPRFPGSFDYEELATRLNQELHQGKRVRNAKSIKNHLYKMRKRRDILS